MRSATPSSTRCGPSARRRVWASSCARCGRRVERAVWRWPKRCSSSWRLARRSSDLCTTRNGRSGRKSRRSRRRSTGPGPWPLPPPRSGRSSSCPRWGWARHRCAWRRRNTRSRTTRPSSVRRADSRFRSGTSCPRPKGSACTRTERSRDSSNGSEAPGNRRDGRCPDGNRPLQPGGGGRGNGVYGRANCARSQNRRHRGQDHGGAGRADAQEPRGDPQSRGVRIRPGREDDRVSRGHGRFFGDERGVREVFPDAQAGTLHHTGRGVAESGAGGDRRDREGQMNPPRVLLWVLLAAAVAVPGRAAAQSRRTPADSQLARGIFRELIEINTTDSLGNTPRAARAMAQRLLAAGFPAADVRVLLGPDAKHGNLVARYRGTAAGGRPIIVFAHLDVVPARRADWSVDPFTFLEKDGYFYGRGSTDNKAGAA